jgi:hypothetical protein
MFYEKETESGKIYCSDLIPELQHCFTTRDTGVNDEHSAEFMAEYFGVKINNFIHPTQTHSSNVDFAREGITNYPETYSLILTNKEQTVIVPHVKPSYYTRCWGKLIQITEMQAAILRPTGNVIIR